MFHYYKGLKIYYEKIGNGEPIVFLHGWGCSCETFRVVAQRISRKFTVYLLDLPGFGKSDEPDTPLDVVGVMEVVKSFLDFIQVSDFILVGHSYGGRVAAEYASRFDSVSKLILIDSAGIKRFSLGKFIRVRIYKFKKWFYKLFKKVNRYNNLVVNSGSADYIKASFILKKMLVMAVNYDQKNIFKKIRCKSLLIWGERDVTTSLKDGRLINKLIKNSELVVIPDCGHFPFLENYHYFMRVFEEYLEV